MKPDITDASYQTQIDCIMRYFNFMQVEFVMLALNCGWARTDGAVPGLEVIQAQAREMLVEVASNPKPKYWIETAGFRASKRRGLLKLEFILEDWDGEYAEEPA